MLNKLVSFTATSSTPLTFPSKDVFMSGEGGDITVVVVFAKPIHDGVNIVVVMVGNIFKRLFANNTNTR